MRRSGPPRSRAAALLASAAACAALVGCTYRIGERDLLHPKKLPVMSEEVSRRNVTVRAADGTALRGWFLSPPGARRAILWLYGNGETAFDALPLLYPLAERLEADVLAVDYRGYGWSDGQASLAGIAGDAPLMIDALAELAGPRKPLFVAGRSLGTVFALAAVLDRTAAGVILFAPPTTVRDVLRAWERNAPWYVRPFLRLRPDETVAALRPQPIEAIAGLAVPLLVIHGTEDRTIPFALGREMYERAGSASKRLCEVGGAGHNNLDLLRGPAAECLARFLDSIAPP